MYEQLYSWTFECRKVVWQNWQHIWGEAVYFIPSSSAVHPTVSRRVKELLQSVHVRQSYRQCARVFFDSQCNTPQRWNRVSGSRVTGSPIWVQVGSGQVTGQSPDPAFWLGFLFNVVKNCRQLQSASFILMREWYTTRARPDRLPGIIWP